MPKLRGALAAVLAAACGGSQHASPSAPAAPPPEIRSYAPLGARADAQRADEAVIPGTDARDTSTVLALPAVPRPVRIDGGEVAVAPSAGPPAQLPAGTWTAALVATTALDKDAGDLAFSAPAGAPPALAATAFLAALTGAPVDPSATVIGDLAPDGTLLPDPHAADELAAARARGKQRIGVPRGAGLPAPAIELDDVGDAYRLLTGRTLPAPVPVAEAEMAIDPATTQALEARYQHWQHELATPWATIVQLDTAGRLPAMLLGLRAAAQREAQTAEALHKRGLVAAAYSHLLAAWAYAISTTATYELLAKVRADDVAGAREALDRLATVGVASGDALRAIAARHPTTLGEHLAMIAAFKSALEGWAFGELARGVTGAAQSELAGLADKSTAELGAPAVADEVVAAVAPVAVYQARRAAGSALAEDELELEPAAGVAYAGPGPALARQAAAIAAAARAGVAQLDARLVAPLAKAGVAPAAARARVALAEPDFFVASLAAGIETAEGLPAELRASWGEHSLAWTLLELAAAELAYGDASAVLASTGSFADHRDASVAGVLAAADRATRASAREARAAAGAIPIQARLAYQLAQTQRTGDAGEQLDALGELWASSAMSQIAVMLARD